MRKINGRGKKGEREGDGENFIEEFQCTSFKKFEADTDGPQLMKLDLRVFNFMVVRKQNKFSRNYTSNFDLFPD
jgi:hypothetical protein